MGYHALMNRFLSATHTLHQVESLFREEILFAIGRKAHRLPKLSLCDKKKNNNNNVVIKYNKFPNGDRRCSTNTLTLVTG